MAGATDVAVIGAGVVGLATARALALAGREVIVFEAEPAIGTHTSSRNSEVIHAGLYYESGSLKARLCVAGKHALYAYAEAHGVPHARLGKLVVASRESEIPALEALAERAAANGVHDLAWLDRREVAELEPAVVAERGLLSPSTGIVDSHELMRAFRRDAIRAGALVLCSSPVQRGTVRDAGIELELGGSEPSRLLARAVVNAAGLFAPAVTRSLAGIGAEGVPVAHYAKGHYFFLRGRSPFGRLVYPVPVPGALGVHVTLDLAGRARFGPDLAWLDRVDYTFDESRADSFYRAVRAYYPALPDGALEPGYTGIRPKLGPAGSAGADFVVHGPERHAGAPLVALYGIESPGLTAALALADYVRGALGSSLL